jgi:hypothetical protein
MTFDELKKHWSSEQADLKLPIEHDLLLKMVKRNKQWFESAILWRDVREIGVAVMLVFFFLYFAIKHSLWPLYLLALLCSCIAVFMVADRIVQKRRHPCLSDSLLGCIKTSIAQIDHQIWLLKNVLYWYLLPFGVGVIIWFTYCGVSLAASKNTSFAYLLFILACICGTVFLHYGVYRLNQRAVRKELLPRRTELEQLLNALTNANHQSAS